VSLSLTLPSSSVVVEVLLWVSSVAVVVVDLVVVCLVGLAALHTLDLIALCLVVMDLVVGAGLRLLQYFEGPTQFLPSWVAELLDVAFAFGLVLVFMADGVWEIEAGVESSWLESAGTLASLEQLLALEGRIGEGGRVGGTERGGDVGKYSGLTLLDIADRFELTFGTG
jgi:hypothetical protein